MKFEFATATRVLFGAGTIVQAGPAVLPWGRCALVVTGANPRRAKPLAESLSAAGVAHHTFNVAGEPTLETVREGLAVARRATCDFVIGFGGGSALDAAKAIAALLTNEGDPLDYLEVIGPGRPLRHAPVPCMAIPTTAGTGSEVTRNAVLGAPAQGVKVSLRSPLMLPRLALVDPELALTLPPAATASTGLDALTQLVEAFVSIRANPVTDSLCREGIRRVVRSLEEAWAEGTNLEAREDMALAALFSGMALANAGLGAVHGFAAPIGGSFAAPHGAVCAALLPGVIAANLAALRARAPRSPALARYEEVAVLLTGNAEAVAEDAIAWTQDLVNEFAIPRLRAYGISEADLPALAAHAQQTSSMKGNPLPLTDGELIAVLREAI